MSAATAIMAAAAVASAAVAYQNGQDQKKAAQNASRQAQANADKAANQAQQDFNRANQKQPDTAGILAATQQAGKAGASGTMLTGPTGIKPDSITLGKTTLLGG